MNKGGSIFPERVDSYSQLPLLKENTIVAIAANSIRSAVVKIEEVIGERVLDSKFFKSFDSIKDRLDYIEERIYNYATINGVIVDIDNGWTLYSTISLKNGIWKSSQSGQNMAVVIEDGKALIAGAFWITSSADLSFGDKIIIVDGILVKSNAKNYFGTIVSKKDSLFKIMIKSSW
jgi:hypothetical protein